MAKVGIMYGIGRILRKGKDRDRVTKGHRYPYAIKYELVVLHLFVYGPSWKLDVELENPGCFTNLPHLGNRTFRRMQVCKVKKELLHCLNMLLNQICTSRHHRVAVVWYCF